MAISEKDAEAMKEICRRAEEAGATKKNWSKVNGRLNEVRFWSMKSDWFVSFASNQFARDLDALAGRETPPEIDSAQPETAIVVSRHPVVQFFHDIFRSRRLIRWEMRTMTEALEKKKPLPLAYKLLGAIHRPLAPRFLILRGDHRDAYEEIITSSKSNREAYRRCLAYYEEKSGEGQQHFFSSGSIKKLEDRVAAIGGLVVELVAAYLFLIALPALILVTFWSFI